MKFYGKYMIFMGITGNLMFFIQAYKIFTTHSAVSISLTAFLLSFVGLNSWLIYGFLLKSKPLILANLAGVIGVSLVLVGTLIYG